MSISRPGHFTREREREPSIHYLGNCIRPKAEFGRFADKQNFLSFRDLSSDPLGLQTRTLNITDRADSKCMLLVS